jgi:Putative DNA-binding domain
VPILGQRFRRVEELIGQPISDALTEEHLQRLVDQGVAESDDLEFKRLYGHTPEGRAEVAKDMASFANHGGGVIIVGMAEASGVASKLQPSTAFGDPEIRRIRSVVADRVHPQLMLQTIPIPSTSEVGKSFLLILVPKSESAPHAVSEPKEISLRYWVRDGSQTRALGESEVADRYRDRFANVRGHIARLDLLMSEGQSRLDREMPFLAVGVIPESPGRMSLDAGSVKRLGEWAARAEPLRMGGLPLSRYGGPARVGMRRVHVAQSPLPSDLGTMNVELHADGSTYFAHQLWQSQADTDRFYVLDVLVVDFIATALHLAARHATDNVGSWGAALVDARILGSRSSSPPRPILMAAEHLLRAPGGPFSHGVQQISNTIELEEVLPSRHTVDLLAIAEDDTEWMIATRLVATDLMQAFGVPEVLQISSSGALRSAYWGSDFQRYVRWAESTGIEVDNNSVS